MTDAAVATFQVMSVMVLLFTLLWYAQRAVQSWAEHTGPDSPPEQPTVRAIKSMAVRLKVEDDLPPYIRLPSASQQRQLH
ncbi:hypothetical protein [Deinococcus peraridilitoris]|uniref:Uncharacterized protein n=1 Tax=Deinococcus peraridilitoris (strain DSM 19664 / LMG 22246 / CIP 109416 / KR-200) TaxID=937777 RepID=L0A3W2_DEIPD|nr:hypothetical protein [Deinococcus peraridilitoris]AFZ67700.1 hypothetical protein Deipe_2215 [Deinococcus peraridilitoris DSM 19664]